MCWTSCWKKHQNLATISEGGKKGATTTFRTCVHGEKIKLKALNTARGTLARPAEQPELVATLWAELHSGRNSQLMFTHAACFHLLGGVRSYWEQVLFLTVSVESEVFVNMAFHCEYWCFCQCFCFNYGSTKPEIWSEGSVNNPEMSAPEWQQTRSLVSVPLAGPAHACGPILTRNLQCRCCISLCELVPVEEQWGEMCSLQEPLTGKLISDK